MIIIVTRRLPGREKNIMVHVCVSMMLAVCKDCGPNEWHGSLSTRGCIVPARIHMSGPQGCRAASKAALGICVVKGAAIRVPQADGHLGW